MKRDMDLVRDILLKIEEADSANVRDFLSQDATEEEYLKLTEHLHMLIDEVGFVSGIQAHTMAGKNWLNLRLTWDGHEYLDTIKDPEIWRLTKEGATKAGGFSLDLLAALAKGLIKKKIEHHTGIDLDI